MSYELLDIISLRKNACPLNLKVLKYHIENYNNNYLNKIFPRKNDHVILKNEYFDDNKEEIRDEFMLIY